MNLTVKKLRPGEYAAWDNFIDNHPNATVFHKREWLSLIQPQAEIFTVWDGVEIKAGVALIKTKKNGLAGYHIPPYTQYFCPLYSGLAPDGNSLTEEHECISALLGMLKSAAHIDFKLPKGHQSILPYHWNGFESSVTITHIITGSLENYLQGLNKNKLRELKKLLLMKENGEIKIEQDISEAELTNLLRQTAERSGFNPNEAIVKRLVMQAGASVAKKIIIRSAKHGLISFGFFPHDNKAVYNLINASSRISDPVLKTVNLLLLYEAIAFALESKRVFDFEGSMLPGVEAFCRLMGGRQVPVYRVQKSPSLHYSLLRAAKQLKNDRKKA